MRSGNDCGSPTPSLYRLRFWMLYLSCLPLLSLSCFCLLPPWMTMRSGLLVCYRLESQYRFWSQFQ